MRSRRPTDDTGAVTIVVVLFMLIILTLAAFVIDFGRVYTTETALQNAVDSAALAAAKDLPAAAGCAGSPPATGTSACKVAGDYLVANGVDRASASVTATAGGNRVAVQASRTVPFVFGPLVGVPGRTVSARAAATKASTRLGNFAFFTEQSLDNNGNPSVTGDVYAGRTLAIGGSTTITGNVWVGGRASPASAGTLTVTGAAARITGNATATGTITTNRAANIGGTRSPNSTVPSYTAVGFAQSVGLESTPDAVGRIATDQSDPNRTNVSGACNLNSALPTTTVLICTGAFSTASNNNWTTLKPNLRTVIASSFSWTGQQTMGTWPSNPFLLYATTGGFSGSGGPTINGYIYAPNGAFSMTGTPAGDFRVITAGNITVRGNMTTVAAAAYEDATLGGVRLVE